MSMLWMFPISVLLGFFITSSLLVNQFQDITNSLTKLYSAVWMALWMLMMMLVLSSQFSVLRGIVVILAIITVFCLARKQIAVDDCQYLRAMIQHHSSAILTSDRILEKTENSEVKNLAQSISRSQQEEINLMNKILEEKCS